MNYHQPVLIKEVLQILDIQPGFVYVDATLGNGGHTLEILKLGGKVFGIDQDLANLDITTKRIKDAGLSKNFIPIHSNFNQLEKIITSIIKQKIDGLLVDLG